MGKPYAQLLQEHREFIRDQLFRAAALSDGLSLAYASTHNDLLAKFIDLSAVKADEGLSAAQFLDADSFSLSGDFEEEGNPESQKALAERLRELDKRSFNALVQHHSDRSYPNLHLLDHHEMYQANGSIVFAVSHPYGPVTERHMKRDTLSLCLDAAKYNDVLYDDETATVRLQILKLRSWYHSQACVCIFTPWWMEAPNFSLLGGQVVSSDDQDSSAYAQLPAELRNNENEQEGA